MPTYVTLFEHSIMMSPKVTGIRKDPWANAHRIQVEEDKPANEQGYYLYPDLYGQPEEKGISQLLFPTQEEMWQEMRRRIETREDGQHY